MAERRDIKPPSPPVLKFPAPIAPFQLAEGASKLESRSRVLALQVEWVLLVYQPAKLLSEEFAMN